MTAARDSRLMEMIGNDDEKFNAKETKVLKYLLANEKDLLDLSISDIADNAGVSKGTVVRFCKVLSFNGLKDFKVWYEAGKSKKHNPVVSLKGDESFPVVSTALRNALSGTLEKTLDDENLAVLSSVMDQIRNNDRISVVAGEEESPFALTLVSLIRKRFPEKNVSVNDEADPSAPFSLVFSLSGNDRKVVTHLTDVILGGGKVTAFTADGSSLVGKASSSLVLLSNDTIASSDEHLLGRMSLMSAVDFLGIILLRE